VSRAEKIALVVMLVFFGMFIGGLLECPDSWLAHRLMPAIWDSSL